MLDNGFHEVPRGKVAAVVTHLEMLEPAPERVVPEPQGVSLDRVAAPDVDWYRGLFRTVGAEDWLWFSRLVMDRSKLEGILSDPANHVYVLKQDGQDKGLLELDFRQTGDCELAFFGLSSDLIGGGVGRWMMNQVIRLAWAAPIRRFHVHTCTLDSPAALPFYMRSGFVPVRQQIEIADDPRLTGLVTESAAPQVPIFR